MRRERMAAILGRAIAIAAAFSAACVDQVETGLNPCPCSSGYVCCESGVCAADSASCGAATAALSESVEGVWAGYIEGFYLTEDSIRIAIQTASGGAMTGQVTFGDVPPPPPVTDPDVGWPPGVPAQTFVSGFPYAAQDINWQSLRLRLRLVGDEPYEPWCTLQTPYYWAIAGDPPYYNCFTEDVWSDGFGHCYAGPMPDATVEIDCGQVSTCGQCRCDSTHCQIPSKFAPAEYEAYFKLDVAFTGSTATGSINFGGDNFNLRLTRSQ